MRRFALRRLSPYLGVTQVVQGDQARAFSHDGEVWQIQVMQVRRAPGSGRPNAEPGAPAYLNTAIWTRRHGQRALPLDPMFETSTVRRLRAEAENLAAELGGLADQLPFDQVDHLELWLLEAGGDRPLALLDSRLDAAPPRVPARPGWVPGDTQAQGLSEILRERATRDGQLPARAAWILRDAGGGGRRVAGDEDLPQVYAAVDFPPLMVCEDWPEPEQARLVESWLRGVAPRLLLVQGLPAEVRRRVEAWAAEQALEVARWHRLYPEIVDSREIKRALVEAELRRSEDRPGGSA